MATTQNTYTGNGSTTNYSFTFEYLKQSDVKVTLDTVATTAFSFVNATTLGFNTAPGSGVAIRIFRDTAIDNLSSTFFPGSAIKAEDLNNNFTQNLYVTQEADTEVAAANTTASSAVTTANTANTKADNAVSTANTASTNATNAVTTANSATTTANTASTNATTAVTTANTASTNASNAVTTANTASTNATAAVNTANTASTNATAAVNTANTASTNASSAVTTANSATTTANSAVTTANSAVTTANTANTNATSAATSATSAQTSATSAQNSATAAAASAAASANVADAFTATGTPATLLTVDVPIDAANGVKLPTNSDGFDQEGAIRYNTTLDKIEIRKGSGWNTAAGGATVSATPPTLASSGDVWYDHDNGRAYVYYNDGDSNQWVEMNPSWNGYVADNSVTSAKIVDGTIVDADINGSAAIAGTKISPDFGSQNVLTTGNVLIGTSNAVAFGSRRVLAVTNGTTGGVLSLYNSTTATANPRISSNPTGSEINDIGIHAASTNGNIIAYTNNDTERIRVTSGGLVNITGGLQVTENITPTSGSGVEIFKPSATSGQISAFNRDSSAWMDLITKGNTQQFHTNGSERMRIDSSGKVGIGGSPTYMLDVQGTDAALRLKGTSNTGFIADQASSGLVSLINYDSGADLRFGAGGAERMRIDSAGKIGVGTVSPPHELSVHGATSTTGTIEANRFSVRDNYGNPPGLGNGFYSPGANVLAFATNSTERMRLDANGNLGVGISAPNNALHVYKTGDGQTPVRFQTSNTTGNLRFYNDSVGWSIDSEGDLRFVTNRSGSGTPARMVIDSAGVIKAQAGKLYVQNSSVSGTGNADGLALIVDGNADAYLWNCENTSLRFGVNNTEKMRLDSDGRLLLGTSTEAPNAHVTVRAASPQLSLYATPGNNSIITLGDTDDWNIGQIVYENSNNSMHFSTNNATRMSITSAGDVRATQNIVCSDSANNNFYNGSSGVGLFNLLAYSSCGEHIEVGTKATQGWANIYLNRWNWTSGNDERQIVFSTNQTTVGSITANASSTSYNTSSDYRLKENVVKITDGITRVKQLQPKRFNFIIDADTTVDGFLAHEAQQVVPEAVTGEKDGEEMQGIDQAKLVPLLTAALQEAIAKIETLETKVAQLEANN